MDLPLWQLIFDGLFTIVMFLAGWWVRALMELLRELRDADRVLTGKVQELEVTVAGHYVQRTELDRIMNSLRAQLDRIETKLDNKADKHDMTRYSILEKEHHE
ncbi:MAG: hypothetical protein KGL39_09810 [Patescibacteria group bacterium]|nr:hypothetical protein [Patescibacteria group bacterium]